MGSVGTFAGLSKSKRIFAPFLRHVLILSKGRTNSEMASYKAAIDAGATSNKEPSLRPERRADYFTANISDPGGYNIEIAYKPWLYK